MVGIIYDSAGVRFEPELLEVEECVSYLEKNYKALEKGLVPHEIVKKVVDAYKDQNPSKYYEGSMEINNYC